MHSVIIFNIYLRTQILMLTLFQLFIQKTFIHFWAAQLWT